MKKGFTLGALLAGVAASAAAQTPQPLGPEFLVNTYTTGRQGPSRLAVEPDGDFVVVWTSRGQDGSGYGIFGRRYDADGIPRGAEFRVNTYTTGDQEVATVAVGSDGAFDVVWTSEQDGSGTSIQGQRYDGLGNPVGGEFQLNTYTSSFQYWPQIARAADGRFVVAWMSHGQDGNVRGIAARRYDAAGNALGSDFVVNTYTLGWQNEAAIASDAAGNFVVVWRDEAAGRDGSGWGVFGQRFDAAGNRLGGDFVVNTFTTEDQFSPSIAMTPSGGGFVVAFGTRYVGVDHYAVLARRFDSAGNGIGGDFFVNTYTTAWQLLSQQALAVDGAGNFVVTWVNTDLAADVGDIVAQRLDPTGNKIGGEFVVNQYTTGWQQMPAVASDSAGNFVITWLERNGHDGSEFGTFARRYGTEGFAPLSLVVDPSAGGTSNGNGILEPGEEVELRPAWLNGTSAAHAVTGMLSDLTGPPGPTYAITDAAADYGTIPPGGNASCTDCYAVSISDPAVRPAIHWDASVRETIGPVVDEKGWTLHVGRSFIDVPVDSGFYPSVEAMLHNGVTFGCQAGDAAHFCPAVLLTRAHLAKFLLLAKEGPAYAPPACVAPGMFADVPAESPFCRWIEELFRRGAVTACRPGYYCPDRPVLRQDMAVSVLLTLDPAIDPPPCVPPNVYLDVPETSPYCRWIEELANRGLTADCGGGNFCPNRRLKRGDASPFIATIFGLTF